ncbi:hypothetical protein J4E05_16700 [Thalassospira sp. NFXS8]
MDFGRAQSYRIVFSHNNRDCSYVDDKGKIKQRTSKGTIHYDKNGKVHVVPARP